MNSKQTQRYKKRGWFGESHRHYLAAKGISTTYDYKKYQAVKHLLPESALGDWEHESKFKLTSLIGTPGQLTEDIGSSLKSGFSVARQGNLGPGDHNPMFENYEDFSALHHEPNQLQQPMMDMHQQDEFNANKYFSEKQDLSLSKFLDEAKNGDPIKDPNATKINYEEVVNQNQTAQRDKFFATKWNPMDKSNEEVERTRLRNQDIERVRQDALSKLNRAIDSGELEPKEREHFIVEQFTAEVDRYEDGVIDSQEFKKNVEKKLNDHVGVRNKKLEVFNWG